MLEASLRPDGSVIDAVAHPGIDAGARSASGTAVFPLDGVPRSFALRAVGQPEDFGPDSWTGGFAFALWDRQRAALCAYRDHYGARPLYYHHVPGRLLVASDLPALLSAQLVPAPPDDVTVAEYLATGVPSENRTFHRGVLRVPAASRLMADQHGVRVERYWRPWEGHWRGSTDHADLAEEFRRLFTEAVAETLKDPGPLGVLLSGGPDSSAVLGVAARLARKSNALTGTVRVALTMVFDSVPGCDERDRAREAADLHGVPWRAVPVEGHSPLYRFDDFLARFGEPPCTANLAAETILLEAARREGAVALLDGHDADALFTPTSAYLTELFRRLRWIRLARELEGLKRHHQLRLRRLVRSAVVPAAPLRIRRMRRRAPPWLKPSLVRRTDLEDRLAPPARPNCFEEDEAEKALGARVGLALEATRCLERMHGVEGRDTFFDPALVRFLLSLPLETRYRAGESKILMRRALADVFTPATQRRLDKTNYTAYFDWSLRTHLGSRLEDLSRRGSAWLEPYVDFDRVRPMLRDLLEGRACDRLAIWRLIALERWLVLVSDNSHGGHAS